MQVRSYKLLYSGCEKEGHHSSLDKVCIDSNCRSHELGCVKCIEQFHNGHEVILLSDFMKRLDNLNFSKQQKPESDDNSPIKAVKKAGADYREGIAELRKTFESAMAKIEDCLRYYEKAGEQLWQQLKKEPFGFRYDPN